MCVHTQATHVNTPVHTHTHTNTGAVHTHTHVHTHCAHSCGPLGAGRKLHQANGPGNGCEGDQSVTSQLSVGGLPGRVAACTQRVQGIKGAGAGQCQTGLSGVSPGEGGPPGSHLYTKFAKARPGTCTPCPPVLCAEPGGRAPWVATGPHWAARTRSPTPTRKQPDPGRAQWPTQPLRTHGSTPTHSVSA